MKLIFSSLIIFSVAATAGQAIPLEPVKQQPATPAPVEPQAQPPTPKPEDKVPPEENPQQTPPPQPVIPPPPPVPVLPAEVAVGADWLNYDTMILNDRYQRENFTYVYQAAILRRALSALKKPFVGAEVRRPIPDYDGAYENVLMNFFRAIGAAGNEVVRDAANQYDGHYAIVAKILAPNQITIKCTTIITRREVDPDLVWVRNYPCVPDFATVQSSEAARNMEFVGFLYLPSGEFEQTPHVGIGPDSFKSRKRTQGGR